MVRLVRAIRDKEIAAPAPIQDYWATLATEQLKHFESLDASGRLEQLGLRPAVFARGGIEVGLFGKLEPHVPAEQHTEKLGIAGGGLVVAEAHRGFGEQLYRAERQYDWHPEERLDPVMLGYGSAYRDISELAASETRPVRSIARKCIEYAGNDTAFVEFLRSARTQIVTMKLNPAWSDGFAALLRAS
jgi:hypothetical protein